MPGWDVEYVVTEGNLNAVEVKGTSGDAFINFELTDNELVAARRLGLRYWVFLVANCLGGAVKVYAINYPARLIRASSHVARLRGASVDVNTVQPSGAEPFDLTLSVRPLFLIRLGVDPANWPDRNVVDSGCFEARKSLR